MNLLKIFNWFQEPEQPVPVHQDRVTDVVQFIRDYYQSPARAIKDKRSYGKRLTFKSIHPQPREIKYFNEHFSSNNMDTVASVENNYLVVKVIG
jgi:hypothetical protein